MSQRHAPGVREDDSGKEGTARHRKEETKAKKAKVENRPSQKSRRAHA